MFVILVYDFGEKRVAKALKICRKYLNWVQNSVFEGELTNSSLFILKKELGELLKPTEDSIIIYEFRSLAYYKRETMGLDKCGDHQFL